MSFLRLCMLAGAGLTAYLMIPRNAGDLTTSQLANAAQDRLPLSVGNGAHAVAVAAEGETLVFHIDGPTGWLNGMTREEVAAAMRRGLCGDEAFSTILASGKSVRVDVSSNKGAPIPGDLITDCPDGSGGGT